MVDDFPSTGGDSEMDTTTLKFIDFDNAQWAYRAFDFVYFFNQMRPRWPNQGKLKEVLVA